MEEYRRKGRKNVQTQRTRGNVKAAGRAGVGTGLLGSTGSLYSPGGTEQSRGDRGEAIYDNDSQERLSEVLSVQKETETLSAQQSESALLGSVDPKVVQYYEAVKSGQELAPYPLVGVTSWMAETIKKLTGFDTTGNTIVLDKNDVERIAPSKFLSTYPMHSNLSHSSCLRRHASFLHGAYQCWTECGRTDIPIKEGSLRQKWFSTKK